MTLMLAPGTVSITGDRAQGDDGKQCAYSSEVPTSCYCLFNGLP